MPIKLQQVLHWAGQIAPPLLLLFIYTSHGPGLWFLIGIPFLCFLVSVITLAMKLAKLRNNLHRIARPALTILVSIGLIAMALHSYTVATVQADLIFKEIDNRCKKERVCPSRIDGWDELEPSKRYETKVGEGVYYPLTYYNSSQSFRLYLYQSLDLGKSYEGGI